MNAVVTEKKPRLTTSAMIASIAASQVEPSSSSPSDIEL
jgi:hypothetical protein